MYSNDFDSIIATNGNPDGSVGWIHMYAPDYIPQSVDLLRCPYWGKPAKDAPNDPYPWLWTYGVINPMFDSDGTNPNGTFASPDLHVRDTMIGSLQGNPEVSTSQFILVSESIQKPTLEFPYIPEGQFCSFDVFRANLFSNCLVQNLRLQANRFSRWFCVYYQTTSVLYLVANSR